MSKGAPVATREALGLRIKVERVQRKRAASSVALAAGLDPSHYSRIENGHVMPQPDTLDKIAETLGVPVSTLLRGE